jgi:hypothetical protein
VAATDAALVVAAAATASVGISLCYFRRWELRRPALGVFNVFDVAVLVAVIAAAPYLYLALPRWGVSALLGVALLNTFLLAAEPLLRRPIRWTVVTLVLAADIAAASLGSPAIVFAANDVVAVLAVAAVANIWAQAGLAARDVTILACALTLYDVIATIVFPITGQILTRVAGVPFAPLVAWPLGGDAWFGVGLGDLLIASLVPLVFTKAYGTRRGGGVAVLNVLALITVAAVTATDAVHDIIPFMVVLGPLTVLSYLAFHRESPHERTTYEYRKRLELDHIDRPGHDSPAVAFTPNG